MANPAFSAKDSFRVPNSIVQGLTTCTATGLNSLTAFQIVTLLGLLARVSPKSPEREVRTTVSEILRIIEVSRTVAHAVEREWETARGDKRQRKYSGRRFSPSHIQKIHEVLLVLHKQTVIIRSRGSRKKVFTDRVVHILDSFGYVYKQNGEILDLDDLPPGSQKINISTDDRPVYRIHNVTGEGKAYHRPSGVLFRLNTELAQELSGEKHTIKFTIIAGKVFGLFRHHMRSPAAICLILLILRQTNKNFVRKLSSALEGLGWDMTHPTRAAEQCAAALTHLRDAGLVTSFDVDQVNEKLQIEVNREWYYTAC